MSDSNTRDGAGIPITSTTSALDVNIKSGTPSSLPLPSNAAIETGGNLATTAYQTRNDAQILDVLNSILAQLRLLNLNYASDSTSAYVDQDTFLVDNFNFN